MNGAPKKVAVYTTIYSSAEPYLRDWYCSLQAQIDQDYQLWIGLDGMEPRAVERVIGSPLEATWIRSEPGDTPSQIRQRAMAQIVEVCDGVVLVDSDDMLQESRVGAARCALEISDLTGCALRLVDRDGQDLGITFGLPQDATANSVLPQYNVFGFSNSAYRSDLLRRCLPIPTGVALVDWFLATQAWLMGARLTFDSAVRMDYRQHRANMVRVRGPFTEQQVIEDTGLVRKHFRTFRRRSVTDGYLPERFAKLEHRAEEVELFYRHVTSESAQLTQYVAALNALPLPPLWWVSVAHPALEYYWHPEKS